MCGQSDTLGFTVDILAVTPRKDPDDDSQFLLNCYKKMVPAQRRCYNKERQDCAGNFLANLTKHCIAPYERENNKAEVDDATILDGNLNFMHCQRMLIARGEEVGWSANVEKCLRGADACTMTTSGDCLTDLGENISEKQRKQLEQVLFLINLQRFYASGTIGSACDNVHQAVDWECQEELYDLCKINRDDTEFCKCKIECLKTKQLQRCGMTDDKLAAARETLVTMEIESNYCPANGSEDKVNPVSR